MSEEFAGSQENTRQIDGERGFPLSQIHLVDWRFSRRPHARICDHSVEASESQTATEEVAVMLDTFSPLGVTAAARSVSDPAYPFSWAR